MGRSCFFSLAPQLRIMFGANPAAGGYGGYGGMGGMGGGVGAQDVGGGGGFGGGFGGGYGGSVPTTQGGGLGGFVNAPQSQAAGTPGGGRAKDSQSPHARHDSDVTRGTRETEKQ